ncbi:DNA-binding response regulator, LytR/AlgR family [Catalinimonas alkaloidigena]|uniref:DNA-binding response regulator, LytR/AlgR family n=1 Tax=Catalinimonas alkaloidigena TaxID=1075417 RepID=A0A1G8Y362_9BACT|nr:LytTR family DNA-binding domain-containing protein [Catalinimonas alkaloidigena]SDJ96874.1 DNA-binding response regulator, LytR/AlgR family [Catalinimonas alkaloidigena]
MNVLIVDDSPVACEIIREFVADAEPSAQVIVAHNGVSAYKILSEQAISLMFLDIEMPEMDGMELLDAIEHPIPTILVTHREEFALESYQYEVVDYLVKPVKYSRFLKAYQKAKRNFLPKLEKRENSDIFVKEGYNLVRLNLEEVLYVEAMSDYIAFHTSQGKKHLVMMTMRDATQKLPEHFLRVHRSYIVNCRKIDVIEDNGITINKQHIPVSNTYKDTLMQYLKVF